MTRLCATLAAGLVMCVATGAHREQGQARDEVVHPAVAEWLAAVERHRPGFNDPAIQAVRYLSPVAFAEIRKTLEARARLSAKLGEPVEIFNGLVHRGALLHMDAAMVLNAATRRQALPAPPTTGSQRGFSLTRPTAVLSSDGGYEGVETVGPHWQFGRSLIDLTLPEPSANATARLWYLSAAAFLSNRSLLSDLRPHLEKGRKLFPSDPDMLFASGCYFEAMGSPRVRPVIDSPVLPSGVHVSAPSARESWRRAEEDFRRAIEIDPTFAPARVRRARVLGMLGRYEEAVRELREAVTRTTDPALLYYAAMFDGAAREGLGDAAAARASYERAAAAFPNAQSPYLALSHLARDRGDRVAALAAMQQVFSGRARTETDEPMWAYYYWYIRNGEDLFVQLRQPFGPSGADPAKERGADSGTGRGVHR